MRPSIVRRGLTTTERAMRPADIPPPQSITPSPRSPLATPHFSFQPFHCTTMNNNEHNRVLQCGERECEKESREKEINMIDNFVLVLCPFIANIHVSPESANNERVFLETRIRRSLK